MYRIARIRAAGIGPADARYDRPAPDAPPFELCCLDSDGQPADTLAWLENGGGKTVLLSLIFHVVRPDKAAQIGKDQKGKRGDIADFVLPGEVGHLAIEWVADDHDQTLITGMAAERRGGNTQRTWYLLSGPADVVSIDDLVFDTDGRRVTYTRFLESLEALASPTSRRRRVELSRTSVQRKWIETLADHHLDPALFEYQVRMNRSEGGATDLFRFSSAEQFVEFFLELTLNPDTVASLGETLSRVADKVGALPRKELELAHATGAVERLRQLSGTWADYQHAEAARRSARHLAECLDDGLAAAETKATSDAEQAHQRVEAATARQQEADRARREADSRARAMAIVAANAKIAALGEDLAARKREADDAGLTATAWSRVPSRLRIDRLSGLAEELREQLEAADRDAGPQRERRDRHLRALRAALAEIYEEADSQARTAQAESNAAAHDASVAEEDLASATGEAREADGRRGELTKAVEAYERSLAEARRAGLLDESSTPADALAAAQSEALSAEDEQTAASEKRDQIASGLAALAEEAENARQKSTEAAHEAREAADRVATAQAERQELAGHPLLVELGADDPDLELVGAELAVRVAAEASRARAEAVTAEVGAAEDRRAAASLETDRLLPSRPDVEDLCRRLVSGGVRSAVPGWRYMVEAVSARRHAGIIAAHPAWVEGIVVAENELSQAKSVLSDVRPAAAVAIVTGAAFTDAVGTPTAAWVVTPAAAMHDRSCAEAELGVRLERLDAAAENQQELTAREEVARVLAERLSVHLEAWPPGALPAASATRDAIAETAENAANAATNAADQLKAAQAEVTALTRQAECAGKRGLEAERRAGKLETLVGDECRAAAASEQINEINTYHREATKRAEKAKSALEQARRRGSQADSRRQAAEQARDAVAREIAELQEPGPGEASPAAPVETLRTRYREAEKALAEATTDSETARRLKEVQGQLSAEQETFRQLPTNLSSRVEELAADPAAADDSSRRQAETAALAAADTANQARIAAETAHQVAITERNNLPEPERPVELDGLPERLDELEDLARAASESAEQARRVRGEADEALEKAKNSARMADFVHEALKVQRSALRAGLGQRSSEPAEPFDGDAAEAVTAALEALTTTTEEAGRADKQWRDAAHEVGVFARQPKWQELRGDLPRRLADDTPDALAAAASFLLGQTQILADRLKGDIEALDTHRQLLITSLGDAVSQGARSLRSARSKSVLPGQLGDWSGHPFLKIGLEVPTDRAELDSRLRRFTNDLLQRAAKAGLPTGSTLVCGALLACSEREVTVEVLKPNKAQRLRYVPVHDMAELSGGMRATAAIAMFCTLVRVRATNRAGRAGVGTLILDNPVGDANATYLVSLQRLVAAMSDIQLIYTTGVNDMDAIRLFPVVTRLTNEAAKRSHLSYVVTDEAFLKQLMPQNGDYSLVTGTRLVRRRPIQLTLDMAGGEDE